MQLTLIREINPHSDAEIDLVAARMRETLIEVEGVETGTGLYSIAWLRERVRWHLDAAQSRAKVYLAIHGDSDVLSNIVGHTIVRVEKEEGEPGRGFGLFSTTFVEPQARRRGIAQRLLTVGEQWMVTQSLPFAATWTSAGNGKLIALYVRNGYRRTAEHIHAETGTRMVKLEKALPVRLNTACAH